MVKIVVALCLMSTAIVPPFIRMFAQVIEGSGGTDAATWAQLGGIGAAMGALAYVAKRFADGSIVARPINEVLEANAKREAAYKQMLDDANDREDAHRALLMGRTLRQPPADP